IIWSNTTRQSFCCLQQDDVAKVMTQGIVEVPKSIDIDDADGYDMTIFRQHLFQFFASISPIRKPRQIVVIGEHTYIFCRSFVHGFSFEIILSHEEYEGRIGHDDTSCEKRCTCPGRDDHKTYNKQNNSIDGREEILFGQSQRMTPLPKVRS